MVLFDETEKGRDALLDLVAAGHVDVERTPDGIADYGIRAPIFEPPDWLPKGRYIVLLHATSRAEKLWDESSWIALGKYLFEK